MITKTDLYSINLPAIRIDIEVVCGFIESHIGFGRQQFSRQPCLLAAAELLGQLICLIV
jgi:hypothetical protein